jgi:photosystem II stability/assembly factor-like uncharacterized protein
LGWLLGVAIVAGLVILVVSLRTDRANTSGISELRTADFHSLAFSPEDPDVVLFGHHNGVLRSSDRGQTWRPLVAQPNFDAMGLAVSRANSRRIYLAGHNIFMISDDGGVAWRSLAHDLPGTDIHAFAMSPTDPARLYAFVVGYGTFISTDGGGRWQFLTGNLRDLMALAAAGGNPEVLFAGSMSLGLLRSPDGGRTWAATTALPLSRVFTVAVDPTRPQSVYAGGMEGLFKSEDGATTWEKLPYPGSNAIAVAISGARPDMILAIAVDNSRGIVHRSLDGGLTWDARP